MKWPLTCGVVVCLPWRLDAVVVVMSVMEGDVSERLPVAEALDWGVMDEEGISPTSRALPSTRMLGSPSAAMLSTFRPL